MTQGLAPDWLYFDNNLPFTLDEVPINGIVCVPEATYVPTPLFVIAHGAYQDFVNSSAGYAYLCAHLASYGYVAASIDAGGFNGGGTGENLARAILQLEHLRQFRTWDSTPPSTLRNNRLGVGRVVRRP